MSSAEPKAHQTLSPAGPVTRDARFNEIERTGEPFDGDFRELRRSYVEGTEHAGWEPRARAAARFDAALTEHLTTAAGRPLVVATHGMVMTVWLSERLGLADPGAFWARLRLPDRIGVDLHSRSARRL